MGDNGVKVVDAGETPSVPPAPSAPRRLKLSESTLFVFSAKTLIGLVGALGIAIAFYFVAIKGRADAQELRIAALEAKETEFVDALKEARSAVVEAKVAVATVSAQLAERKEQQQAESDANVAAHKALGDKLDSVLGEVRMLGRSKETR